MKSTLKITAGLLMLILLLYVALGCLVYCYYEPQIKLEMERQLATAAKRSARRGESW